MEVEVRPTEIRESHLQYLMFSGSHQEPSYQNLGRLISNVIVLCFSSFYFGYCLTQFSTFSKETTAAVYGDEATKSFMQGILIGLLPVGAILGAGIAPLLMKWFSRKQFVLVINLFAFIISGILQINNLYVLLACRACQGIFVGCYMSIIPIYIHELAPKEIVGSFGVFTQLFVVVGIIVSYGLGLILDAANANHFVFYRIMVAANAIMIVIQSVLLLIGYIPESPNSLLKKNKNEEAMKVIGQFTVEKHVKHVLKHKQLEVQHQLEGNQEQDDESQQEEAKMPKIVYAMKAFILGFQLPFMQQLTGINAIVTQANNIVAQTIPDLAKYVSIIINSIQFLATLATIAVLIRVGRKPLTLFGNLFLGIIDIVIGILFIFHGMTFGYGIFALLILYMIVYGISLGPVVWLYVPQIIPAKIVPLATMMNWLGCSICVIFTPIAIDAFDKNPYPVFFFFGGLTLLFFVMNSFMMIETKGMSTRQIAKKFFKQ